MAHTDKWNDTLSETLNEIFYTAYPLWVMGKAEASLSCLWA